MDDHPLPHLEAYARMLLLGLDWSHPALSSVNRTRPLAELAPIVAPRLRAIVFGPAVVPLAPDAPANPTHRFSRTNESAGALAERCIGEGRWISVGREYAFPSGPDYTVSPEPSLNTRDVPFGEWTWQFNRHSEWAVLARLHQLAPDSRYATAVAGWMRRWLEQCPPPSFDYGGHHPSWRTIEVGIRLAQSWPKVLAAFGQSEAIDDLLWLAWLGAWAEQAAFVWRYRKTGNWLMMEMAGLLSAGVCLPFHRDAAQWRGNALEVMRDEAARQFHADGHQVELSANYHMVVVHQYEIARKLLHESGQAIPDWLDPLLVRIHEPMRAMARPDHFVFGFQDTTPIHLSNVLRSLPESLRSENDAWFIDRRGTPPAHRHDLLPCAGYVVLRSGRGERDLAVVMDGGPYGVAHQHEDKLSIQLIAHGTELIGEAGLVDYADSPQRSYSLATRAHSTALVDGFDQNRGSTYNKDEVDLDAPAGIVVDFDAATAWARATYDEGYGPRGAVRVQHTRTISLVDRDTVTVTDQFSADDAAEHTVEILFHVLVEPVELLGQTLLTRGPGGNVAITASRPDIGGLAMSVVTGGDTPDLRGWAQRPTNEMTGVWEPVPRPCLTLTARFTGTLEVRTRLQTFPAGVSAIVPPSP
jgi:hypothetical protein